MKKLTATTFRIVLSVLLVLLVALIVGAFLLGYKHLSTIGEATRTHQAEAAASEDTVTNLQRLRTEITNQSTAIKHLESLQTTDPLPQFSAEHSVRTIANQLGIGITNLSFVNDTESTGAGGGEAAATTTPAEGGAAPAATTPSGASGWGGPRSSSISFEFRHSISYNDLIRFLNALETSTPKLKLHGITIPAESTKDSIEPGTITLEIATSQKGSK